VQDSDVPSTFDELIQPKWKGKLALTYPNDDDAITFLFSLLINKYGWDWFEALVKQDVKWIRGTGEPANYIALANSTRSLSFTTSASGKLKSKKPEDPIMLWPQTSAIFASTLRPESAKLFMSWLLSDEYQARFNGTYGVRKDLAATSNPWDDQSSGLSQFATFMDNRDQVEWWRLQFETSIGTAQGVSPVQSFYGRR
jgi:ABC-type Fe3+ transport system substrate-binding protein